MVLLGMSMLFDNELILSSREVFISYNYIGLISVISLFYCVITIKTTPTMVIGMEVLLTLPPLAFNY